MKPMKARKENIMSHIIEGENLHPIFHENYATIQGFDVIFQVTETCNNGKERTIRKSVFCPSFINTKFLGEESRIEKGMKAMTEMHYYNIKYIESKPRKIRLV